MKATKRVMAIVVSILFALTVFGPSKKIMASETATVIEYRINGVVFTMRDPVSDKVLSSITCQIDCKTALELKRAVIELTYMNTDLQEALLKNAPEENKERILEVMEAKHYYVFYGAIFSVIDDLPRITLSNNGLTVNSNRYIFDQSLSVTPENYVSRALNGTSQQSFKLITNQNDWDESEINEMRNCYGIIIFHN